MRQIRITKERPTDRGESLDRYMNEVAKTPLLTQEEEVELAKRKDQGDEEAKMMLVRANLRFVISVAKQYVGRGLPLADLVNEGNLGLMKAAERYDHERGFKFISYAVWWIRQSILQGIAEQGRIVRLPLNKDGQLGKIKRAIEGILQQNEEQPSMERISEELQGQISPEEINMLLSISARPVRSDDTFPEDDSTIGDAIFISEEDEPFRQEDLRVVIARLLDRLPEREAIILKRYYGIGGRQHTMEEIGEWVGLTRERVRQIIDKANRKIKKMLRDSNYREYL